MVRSGALWVPTLESEPVGETKSALLGYAYAVSGTAGTDGADAAAGDPAATRSGGAATSVTRAAMIARFRPRRDRSV
jgi:hypothetical protein